MGISTFATFQGEVKIQKKVKVGLVTSRFNFEITQQMEKSAEARLIELGFDSDQVIKVRVPGALEIPLAVQMLLRTECEGVVALGAVVRGETAHFDYVCAGVERGCSHLQLKYRKPVGFGVLTVDNEEQAWERVGGIHGNKGVEAVDVVIEMINLKDLVLSHKTPNRKRGEKNG